VDRVADAVLDAAPERSPGNERDPLGAQAVAGQGRIELVEHPVAAGDRRLRLARLAARVDNRRAQVAAQRALGIREQRVADRDAEDDADRKRQEDGDQGKGVVAEIEQAGAI